MDQDPKLDKFALFLENRPALTADFDDPVVLSFYKAAFAWVGRHLCPTEPDRELKCMITATHCIYLPNRGLNQVEITRVMEVVIGYCVFSSNAVINENDSTPFDAYAHAQLTNEYTGDGLKTMINVATTLYRRKHAAWPLSAEDYNRCMWIANGFIAEWLFIISLRKMMNSHLAECHTLLLGMSTTTDPEGRALFLRAQALFNTMEENLKTVH